jgi:hypothetical protein
MLGYEQSPIMHKRKGARPVPRKIEYVVGVEWHVRRRDFGEEAAVDVDANELDVALRIRCVWVGSREFERPYRCHENVNIRCDAPKSITTVSKYHFRFLCRELHHHI